MTPGLTQPLRLIVCGIDFTVWSDLACAGAAALARHFGARVLLVHVVEHRRELEAAEARLRGYAREWLEGLPASSTVAAGDPARELARLARQEGANVIVIGRRHRDQPLVPVTVEAGLAELAPCPVLTLDGIEQARQVIERLEHPAGEDRRCIVCGRLLDGRICSACRIRITWEAMDQKWHEQLREGPGLMGLGGARALGPVLVGAGEAGSPRPPDRDRPRPEGRAPDPRAAAPGAPRWDVVVFGGASRDYLVRGSKLPRPGETVAGDVFLEAPGGKGVNQGVAAARLGARVALGGRVGDDESGREVMHLLASEGVDGTRVVRDPEAPTGVALILVDGRGEKVSASAPGANRRATAEQAELLVEPLASARVLLTQLELAPAAVARAIEIAVRMGVPVVLDAGPPAPAPDMPLAGVDIVRANAVEAEALSGIAVRDRGSAWKAGSRLLNRGAKAAVIAAPGGNLLVTPESDQWIEHFPVDVVDTTGAGDAFAAALAVGLAEGQPLEQTVRFAAAAAALATTRLGAPAALPHRAEVDALLGRPASATGRR